MKVLIVKSYDFSIILIQSMVYNLHNNWLVTIKDKFSAQVVSLLQIIVHTHKFFNLKQVYDIILFYYQVCNWSDTKE